MSRRVVAVFTAGVLAALAAPTQAPAKVLRFEATGVVRKVGQRGEVLRYRGHVQSAKLGRARVTQRVRIAGLSATGRFRVRYRGGTVRGRLRAGASVVGGRLGFTGTFRITGGTGRFDGARGHGRYSGTSAADLSRARFRQRGRIVY